MDPKLEALLVQLVHRRAADLYFFPGLNNYRLVANINGQRSNLQHISTAKAAKWIGHLKYRANMSVSEHRRPQAGAIRLAVKQFQVDLRLSTVGDYRDQESMVIRFIYPLADDDYSLLIPDQWDQLVSITRRRGLLLFAGPTGSGKTTTMYRLARQINSQVIMTIEDPVEIFEPSFLQLQVNELAGMGYQELLKVGLRHRPEIFIIGEIRDRHTAAMAVQAALSGHLVMATVHSRSASGVIARLQQLEINQYLINQSVSGIAYQRLLPTNNDKLAVLFDLLIHQGRPLKKRQNGDGVSEQWKRDLALLADKDVISSKTQYQFQYG